MEHHCDKPAATLSEDQQQEELFFIKCVRNIAGTWTFWYLSPKQDFSVWKFNAITSKIEVTNLFKAACWCEVTCACAQSYHRWSLWDSSDKEEVSDEEADAQVQVDGGAGSLYGAAELKGQDAEYEAQQWDGQPDPGHHQEPKGVLLVWKVWKHVI